MKVRRLEATQRTLEDVVTQLQAELHKQNAGSPGKAGAASDGGPTAQELLLQVRADPVRLRPTPTEAHAHLGPRPLRPTPT
jgi:hypothetical protein